LTGYYQCPITCQQSSDRLCDRDLVPRPIVQPRPPAGIVPADALDALKVRALPAELDKV
jgi:hypothetical protein